MQTFTVITPISQETVELRSWITGRERQWIQKPLYKAAKAKPSINRKGESNFEMETIDVSEVVSESYDRELETFVVSVNDQKTLNITLPGKDQPKEVKAWEYVLDGMHEKDYEFIKKEIEKTAKKNTAQTPQQSA